MNNLSVEDLLKPRYKVIAPDTSGIWVVGDIYTFKREVAQSYDHWIDQNWTEISFNYFNKYPHLFKKLQWWEERKESDMPEYVKFEDESYVIKVDCFVGDIGFNFYHGESSGYGKRAFSKNTLPATVEEYNNQKIKV